MGLFDLFLKKESTEKETNEVAATVVDTETIVETEPIEPQPENDEVKTSIEDDVYLVASTFMDVYRNGVDLMYANLLQTNPEAFRLYSKDNVQIYYFELNKRFFTYNQYIAYVYKPNAKMDIKVLDLTAESYYKYDTPSFQKTEIDILQEFVEELSVKDIVYTISVSDVAFSLARDGEFPSIEYSVKDTLRNEAQSFHKHNNYPQEYYAKNAARYAYSELDLKPLIAKVNNEDFSYQIDQAIAAYDNSLYLASCATLGVCLETVCKLLLVKNGVKMKDSDSTLLDNLTAKLRENRLISFKMKGRIDVCYKVRNLAAHTSPGKIVKSDCHFILNTISEVVEEHF